MLRKTGTRIIAVLTALGLILPMTFQWKAGDFAYGTVTQGAPAKVKIYVKPDVKIIIDDREKVFFNGKGEKVYPIVYNNSVYLPVRGISAMMNEEIEWVGNMRTIYIGKTFSNPYKAPRDEELKGKYVRDKEGADPVISWFLTEGMIRPDVYIMYDFEPKAFKDEKNNRVYPLIFGGSAYLPVRAAAELLNKEVAWNGRTLSVTITSKEAAAENFTAAEKTMRTIYEKAVIAYDRGTSEVKNLDKVKNNKQELEKMAAVVSANCKTLKESTEELTKLSTINFTEKEKEALGKLENFVKRADAYMAMLENIVYLAIQQQNYSVLEESFADLAIKSQKALDSTRKAIYFELRQDSNQ